MVHGALLHASKRVATAVRITRGLSAAIRTKAFALTRV
jgi:hypothetical protein